MVDLALHGRTGEPVRLAAIARRGHISSKFLEAIVVDLRKAGLVVSRRGPDGGHRLARPPRAITLGQIRAAVDGPLALVARRRGGDPVDAGLRSVWKEVEQAMGAVMDAVTVEEMCRRVEVSTSVPDFSI
jgi:Rrf2 family protein